jgi:hypothetical protein
LVAEATDGVLAAARVGDGGDHDGVTLGFRHAGKADRLQRQQLDGPWGLRRRMGHDRRSSGR